MNLNEREKNISVKRKRKRKSFFDSHFISPGIFILIFVRMKKMNQIKTMDNIRNVLLKALSSKRLSHYPMTTTTTTSATTTIINENDHQDLSSPSNWISNWFNLNQQNNLLIRILNYPFRMSIVPLFPPCIVDRITRMKIEMLIENDNNQNNPNNDNNNNFRRFFNFNSLFIFTLFPIAFIRAGFMCLFRYDHHIVTTITGSVFHLLHINRLHPEMVALHFGAEQCLYLLWIFSRLKYYHFFRLLIAYCHQIYDPFLNIVDNKKQRLQLYLDYCHQQQSRQQQQQKPSLESNSNFAHCLGLNSRSIDRISQQIRQQFRMQTFVLISVPIILFLMSTMFLFSIDPYQNNFWLFNYSYLWYSFYNFNLAFFTSVWAYYGLLYTTNFFAYFHLNCLILIEKLGTNQQFLKRFRKSRQSRSVYKEERNDH